MHLGVKHFCSSNALALRVVLVMVGDLLGHLTAVFPEIMSPSCNQWHAADTENTLLKLDVLLFPAALSAHPSCHCFLGPKCHFML